MFNTARLGMALAALLAPTCTATRRRNMLQPRVDLVDEDKTTLTGDVAEVSCANKQWPSDGGAGTPPGRWLRQRPGDLRLALWPQPRSVALHVAGSGEETAATPPEGSVRPPLMDPGRLRFSLEGVPAAQPGLRQAVAWSVRRLCRRLNSARAGAATAQAPSDPPGPSGALGLVELRISAEAAGSSGRSKHGGPPDYYDPPSLDSDESYALVLAPGSHVSSLSAASRHGLNRGLETLLQVLDALVEGQPQPWSWAPGVDALGRALEVRVRDKPRFRWRGVMLDTARHFLSRASMEHVLSAMAANKLNVLHWHITDAMSFPLELRSLPALAQRGSFGPNMTYSVADVRHLVDHAAKLSIRVVPELDMPAHTGSWIFGEPEAVSNCTHVLPDNPVDRKNPFKARDKLALDVSNEHSLRVARLALQELAGLFPDTFMHVGGDEVDYQCWTTMPHIKSWMSRMRLSPHSAMQRFYDSVFAQVKELGRRPVVWQDAFEDFWLPQDAVVQPWKCWGWPIISGHLVASRATHTGRGTVQSTCWYLDWDSDWREFYGHSADEGFTESGSQALFGGEAALWTEHIDFTNMDCRLWPRTAAFAERLWSQTASGEIRRDSIKQDVHTRLLRHALRLQRLHGVNVRPLSAVSSGALPFGAPLTEAELDNVAGTCPLLESQAIQRRLGDTQWAGLAALAFQS